MDDSSHLYYYGARYYDPQLGRFITVDPTVQHPTDPQDFNRYAYARNNPIRFTDPTGLGFWSSFFGIIGAVIGAVIGGMIGGPAGAFAGAMIGGTLGGLSGAAIEKSNLARGAIQGAVIGAVVGSTAVALGAGAGAGAAGVSGGGSGGVAGSGLSGAGQAAIESAPVLVEISGEMAGSAIVPNIVGATILVGSGAGASQMNEVFWKPENYQRYQNEMETLKLEGNGLQYDPAPGQIVGAIFCAGALARAFTKTATSAIRRIYSARELIRSSEESGAFHNFPSIFDDIIYEGEKILKKGFFSVSKPGLSNDSVMYTARGSVNGAEGTFEIFTRPTQSGKFEEIVHRFFRRD